MIKTNKKRNIGILFEALTHSVLEHISANDTRTSSKLFQVLKHGFMRPGTEINKAYKIYSQLLYNESRNVFYASKMLKYLVDEYQFIDQAKLKREVDKLFEMMDNVCDKSSILSRKIPNYKLFSSYNALLGDKVKNLTPKERLACEEVIIEHMIDNKEVKTISESSSEKIDPEQQNVDRLASILALKNFKKKYSGKLTNEQEEAMIKFFTSKSDRSYARWAEKKMVGLVKEINEKKNLVESEDIKMKLEATAKKLDSFRNKTELSSKDLTDLLLSFELKETLNNLGDK